MRRVVAVEEGLTPITLLLKRQGYDVVGLEDSRWKDADAVVLSGMDANFLGVEDRMTEANVVTAADRKSVV